MEVQVTLSRAHKIAERLKLFMNEQSTLAERNLNEVTLVGRSGAVQVETLQKKSEAGEAAVALYMQYNKVYVYVRDLIGEANVKYGVSALLAKQEGLSRRVHLLQSVSAPDTVTAIQPAQLAEYTPLASASERPTMREPSVTVSLVTPEYRAAMVVLLAEAKKESFALSDTIADLNARKVTLELDDTLVGLLGLV